LGQGIFYSGHEMRKYLFPEEGILRRIDLFVDSMINLPLSRHLALFPLALILFLYIPIQAQTLSGKVVDAESGLPIRYANIWMEGTEIGTSVSEEGEFKLTHSSWPSVLVVSAVGYITQRVEVNSYEPMVVSLEKRFLALEEVVIEPKRKVSQRIAPFKLRSSSTYFGSSGTPWMVARYFAWHDSYELTPFLESVIVGVKSQVKEASFSIRIFKVDTAMGLPGEELISIPIIAKMPKGQKELEIRLEERAGTYKFPKEGLYVAFEWLIVEENKFVHTFIDLDKKKQKKINYAPSLKAMIDETGQNSKIFLGGKWTESVRSPLSEKNAYRIPMIDVRLGN
jgi:hypothetical protein